MKKPFKHKIIDAKVIKEPKDLMPILKSSWAEEMAKAGRKESPDYPESEDEWKKCEEKPKIELSKKSLEGFAKFVGDPSKARVWGNGASFDNPILANAYRAVNLDPPWRFWNDRCYRTVKSMFGKNVKLERIGEHHNALDDAKSQADHLIRIMAAIGKGAA